MLNIQTLDHEGDNSMITNNRSTTPVMNKAYQAKNLDTAISRNKSMNRIGALS